jgi:pimeloyl-ACP methyl ester carboxylesterase
MSTAPQQITRLAYERHGAGVPIVFLHGLTFNRRSWRPIVERLGDGVDSIAIDLPGHGESAGPPCPLDELAGRIHGLVESLDVERPIVVGHSMSGGLAMIYAAAYPVRGVVDVDSPALLRPFAQLVRSLEPALRGPGFAQAFEPFDQSMGVGLVPAPLRQYAAQEIRQDVVLGYWDELMRSDPDELQARVDEVGRGIDAPALAVFGRALSDEERDHMLGLLPDGQIEEWEGAGHCVHLSRADRFAARLGAFVDLCCDAR